MDIDEYEKQDRNDNVEMTEKGGRTNMGYAEGGSQDLTQGSSASQVNIEPGTAVSRFIVWTSMSY